jgi:hypothetical protein
MKRLRLIAGLFIWGCCALGAQTQTLELGAFVGGSNYLGDLQQVRFEKDEINYAVGAFLRYNANKWLSWKAHFYHGEISGSDGNYETLEIRKRNLHFRSSIYELGLQLEVTFLQFGERDRRMAAPYFFFGGSYFHFNPQALYEGEWVDLQPLGTEGQGLSEHPDRQKYELYQWAIPLGIGFNMHLTPYSSLGFELGFRKTFTDYLDDISQSYPNMKALEEHNPLAAALSFRMDEFTGVEEPDPSGTWRGDPNSDDFYFFGGVTFSTTLGAWYRGKKPKKRKKRY